MSQGPLYIIARIIAVAAVVFILCEYLYFDVTKRGWRNAKKELPTELKKFGLKFKKSELSHQIGTFSGKFNGREVEVLPDSHASIEIKLKNMPEVILNTVKVPKDTGEFKTGVKQFDSFFKSKFAPENVSKKLMQAKKLHTHVEEFHKTWKRPLSFLEVGRYKIRCAMKYGQQTYIPPKKIEELLSDLCEMADLLEEVLRLDNLKKVPIKGIVTDLRRIPAEP